MNIHKLKIQPQFFQDIKTGKKTFEIRKNDRGYCLGDVLELHPYENGVMSDDSIDAVVTYITDFEQKEGYVVLGIQAYTDRFKGIFKQQ